MPLTFKELYRYTNGLGLSAIPYRLIKQKITSEHDKVGQIDLYPVALDRDVSLGHILFERDRSSPYEDEFTIGSIRFDKDLNRCWRRFVVCKETMHVFDSDDEKASSNEGFRTLLGELESPPMDEDASRMYKSEMRAQWMALLVLLPESIREMYLNKFKDQTMSPYDIALRVKLPQAVVQSALSPSYNKAVARLT